MPAIFDSPPRADYTAGAGQTTFSVTWNFFADTDLIVWVDNVLQVANTDYTVTGAGTDTGGTVVFVSPLTGGEHVAIMGDIPIQRTTNYLDTGPFDMAGLNEFLQRVTAWFLQLEMRMDRMVRLADYVEPKSLVLPLALPSGFLTFDADGNLTVSETTPEIDAAVADAQAAQTAAEAARDAAQTSETNAATSASNASASATLAQDWANEDQGVPVSGGLYSAKHWAQTAEQDTPGLAIAFAIGLG